MDFQQSIDTILRWIGIGITTAMAGFLLDQVVWLIGGTVVAYVGTCVGLYLMTKRIQELPPNVREQIN